MSRGEKRNGKEQSTEEERREEQNADDKRVENGEKKGVRSEIRKRA